MDNIEIQWLSKPNAKVRLFNNMPIVMFIPEHGFCKEITLNNIIYADIKRKTQLFDSLIDKILIMAQEEFPLDNIVKTDIRFGVMK